MFHGTLNVLLPDELCGTTQAVSLSLLRMRHCSLLNVNCTVKAIIRILRFAGCWLVS